MDKITVIGLVASILTSSSMMPQLIKIIKEKKADAISYGMLALIISGLSMWVWYGILKTDWIIIGANAFAVIITVFTAFFSFKYKEKTSE